MFFQTSFEVRGVPDITIAILHAFEHIYIVEEYTGSCITGHNIFSIKRSPKKVTVENCTYAGNHDIISSVLNSGGI